MYPEPQVFYIDLPKVASKLEGRFRPGHFPRHGHRGVKAVQFPCSRRSPYSQEGLSAIGNRAAHGRAVCSAITIIPAETVRADDGLALSSRNRFLSPAERKEAIRLRQAILQVKDAVERGDRNFIAMEYAAGELLARHDWKVDYVVVRTRRGLRPKRRTRNWWCSAPRSSAPTADRQSGNPCAINQS